MQLQQLRYVACVVDEQGFTRAAAKLRVAQPSVSEAIRSLERELGTDLFHRRGGQVTLSPAGEAFLPWARQALADCDAGRAAVDDLRGLRGGRLSLGATPSLTTELLAPVLADFHRLHPSVELCLHEDGSRNLVAGLERAELDLAVVILPIDGSWVRTEALVVEDLVLAVTRDHPLVGRESVGVDDLRGLALVMFRDGYDLRESTMAACHEAGFEATLAVEGLEMDGVLALSAAGLGAAVVPTSVVRPGSGLVAVPFHDGQLRRTIGLASRLDRTTPAARAFADGLRSMVSGTAGPLLGSRGR